jgi:pyridoxamine 5'-phosphate oxidase-like protein
VLELDSRELFSGPNYAHVATSMDDGSPQSVPVWIDVDDRDRLGLRRVPARGGFSSCAAA